MTRRPEIAIVGAGLGGLTLARVLQVSGLEATVYEREPSRHARTQGGMLDLHPDSGQLALRRAGLEAEFLAIARREGQDLRLLDETGTVLLDQRTAADAPLDRPEVDRTDLRTLLLDSLRPDTVRWGLTFRHAQARGDGTYRLELTDGTTHDVDLLVGADGGRSSVRPLVCDAEPLHIGQNTIELQIPDADRNHPELAAVVGRGNYWVLGASQSLSAQRNGDGTIRVYLSFYTDADWLTTCGLAFDRPAAARGQLAALFSGWTPEVAALIQACAGPVSPRPVTMLPAGLRWPLTPGVTLLGDAAHLMPPVGLGANTAMLDGAALGQALAATPDDLGRAVDCYQEAMFVRGAAATEESVAITTIIRRGAGALLSVIQ